VSLIEEYIRAFSRRRNHQEKVENKKRQEKCRLGLIMESSLQIGVSARHTFVAPGQLYCDQ
jgi:hypothetical protein